MIARLQQSTIFATVDWKILEDLQQTSEDNLSAGKSTISPLCTEKKWTFANNFNKVEINGHKLSKHNQIKNSVHSSGCEVEIFIWKLLYQLLQLIINYWNKIMYVWCVSMFF